MTGLPRIMVAPNGARRTKADHPLLPVTIPEIVQTAVDCAKAGAAGLHAHVRDGRGRHSLDVGLYRDLIAEMALRAPGMLVQVTTELAGRYQADAICRVVDQLRPAAASVALRELVPGADQEGTARHFYHRCRDRGVAIQHILYTPEEADRLGHLLSRGIVPPEELSILFVLGSYDGSRPTWPMEIQRFRETLNARGYAPDWMVCAFGPRETECLQEALRHGGAARVGFENNMVNPDGSIARDNAERVEMVSRRGASATQRA